MISLKAANPALKLMMMIGGSNDLQQNAFAELASDEAKIKRFVKESIKYIRMHRFDGIDIDWKVQGKKEHHARLMEALAAGFTGEAKESGQDKLLLATTLPAISDQIQNNFDVGRVSKAVDYMTALLYTYHAGSENLTAHHAPLYAADPDTSYYADFAIQVLKEAGADPARLVMAVPTFGITFTLADAESQGFGAPAKDKGHAGKLTKDRGSLSFTEICEHVSMDGWQAFRPQPDAVGPYAVKGDQWVAYDDEVMMQRKGAYIREQGLGGAAVWALAQDDFRGVCTGRPYPLIEALKEGLLGGDMAPPTTPSPPPTPGYDNITVFACPKNGRFAKMDNCTEFYVCNKGLSQVRSCTHGQKYDSQRDECTENVTCVEQPFTGITSFAPTPSPFTPGQAIPGDEMPKMAKPSVAVFPAPLEVPRTTRPPEAPSTPQDSLVVSSAATALPIAETIVDKDVTDIEELQQPPALVQMPPMAKPNIAAFPAPLVVPRVMRPPAATPATQDSVVVSSAATPSPTTETMVDKDIADIAELQQLLALVQRLGGVSSLQKLLAAMDGPKRSAAQPSQTTVTETGSDPRVKVHVIVEVKSL
ncbi:chitotriosidase-1-like [Pollicipes pollicipes]|nr:chitotriosidase-1-like [Pollicipes pollicipes]